MQREHDYRYKHGLWWQGAGVEKLLGRGVSRLGWKEKEFAKTKRERKLLPAVS